MPLVSIIVPVYNTAKYINNCLQSLISQTYNNIEIICIDDASTDNSLSLLKSWAGRDDRIIVIESDRNGKQGTARNKGLRFAHGDFIAFVDSDDFVSSCMIETMLSNNEDYDLIICEKNYRHSTSDIISTNLLIKHGSPNKTDDIKRNAIVYGCMIWACIAKRTLFFENNLFFPEHVFYEDIPLVYNLILLSKKIKVIENAPLYYYRVDNSSTMRKRNSMRMFDRLYTTKLFYEDTKLYGQYEKYKEEIEYTFYRIYYQNTINHALNTFDSLPIEKIEDTVRSYHSITNYDIKKNHYFRMNKPSLVVRAVAIFPRYYRIIIPIARIMDKTVERMRRLKKSVIQNE
jgi:glycosyltransferase involved in cell wall biosynthesis